MPAPKLTVAEVEEAVGPIEGFAHNCHGASVGPKQMVIRPCQQVTPSYDVR